MSAAAIPATSVETASISTMSSTVETAAVMVSMTV